MDIRLDNQYCKVTQSGEVVVSQFFEKARVETEQTVEYGDVITDISPDGIEDLPDSGWIEKDMLYNYQGTVVHCIQSHERTIYPPEQTPALFAVYRTNADDLEWITGEKVLMGWKRIYKGKTYVVLQAHMTQESWNPEATVGTLWQVQASSSEWEVGVAYKVGDIVTYQGDTYKCLQAHTSQATWTPPAVPALWEKQ